jgi:hypothetical protein
MGLLVGGLVVTAIAAGSLLAGAGSVLVPLLALVGGLGTLGTATILVRDVDLDAGTVAAGVDSIDAALARIDDVVAALDARVDAELGDVDVRGTVDVHRKHEARIAEVVEAHPVAHWITAGLGVLGAAGLLLLGAWTALGLTGAAVAGVALSAYGLAHVRALEDAGQRIRRQRSVCLYLVDGRTVRFRIDDDADIDRELSRLTAQTAAGALPSAGADATAAGEHGTGENGSGNRGTGRSGA